MREYSFSEAQQNLSVMLEYVKQEGVVCIKKSNGELFYIQASIHKKSPLDVDGVNLGLSKHEIVETIRESRAKDYR